MGERVKRWIVLQGSPKTHHIFALFRTRDREDLKTFDRFEAAREHKALIRHKWPHLNAWIVELDFDEERLGPEP